MALIALSCSSSDDTTPDAVVGKWFIYRAEYSGGAIYNYQINGQCGAESLQMSGGRNNNFVTETYYSNEDCTGFNSNTEWDWKKQEDGTYNIYMIGQTVPERILEFQNENEIKVTEPDIITVVKYYRRAL